jgi:hypothetical protein
MNGQRGIEMKIFLKLGGHGTVIMMPCPPWSVESELLPWLTVVHLQEPIAVFLKNPQLQADVRQVFSRLSLMMTRSTS